MSPNGNPAPPRTLRRGDRVTIILPGGSRRTGTVHSNNRGWVSLGYARYPLTAIRQAIIY